MNCRQACSSSWLWSSLENPKLYLWHAAWLACPCLCLGFTLAARFQGVLNNVRSQINLLLGGPVEKMWFFQMAQIPLLSVLICPTRCQYDILKVSLKKMTSTYPLGASNIEIFCTDKNPILHAIASHFCIRQRTCIQDFLSMHFSLYTLLKDACKVLRCDSNTKWSVGAITGVGRHG